MHNATKLRQELNDLRVQLVVTAADNERLRTEIALAGRIMQHSIAEVLRTYPNLTESQARAVMEQKVQHHGNCTWYYGIQKAAIDLGVV